MESRAFDRMARLLAGAATRRQGLAALAGALAGAAFTAGPATAGKGNPKGRKPEASGPCGDGSRKDNRCTNDKQCCTGICDVKPGKKNKDKAGRCRCLKNGKACKADKNCCTTSVCFNGSCAACRKPNQSCDGNGDCCGGNFCIGKVCQACRDNDQSCTASSDCCSGLACYNSSCAPCVADGKACSANADCCTGLGCYNGSCSICVTDGQTCSSDEQCCSGSVCFEGLCALPRSVPNGDACIDGLDSCTDPDASCTMYQFEEPVGTYCLLPRKANCSRDLDCVSRDCPGDVCVACSHPACTNACEPIVCKNGCTYNTIQAAIDNASEGDVIDIGRGEYRENLIVFQSVTLRACKGQPVTIQNKDYNVRTITVTGEYFLGLIDITVEALSDLASGRMGGGIETRGSLALFRYSAVRNGEWPVGGGILAGEFDTVDEFNPTGLINPAESEGGAFEINILDQSIVEDNTALYAGGGIFAGWYGQEEFNPKNGYPRFEVYLDGSAMVKDNTVLNELQVRVGGFTPAAERSARYQGVSPAGADRRASRFGGTTPGGGAPPPPPDPARTGARNSHAAARRGRG
ncbi:MAG: hypothetical protein ACKOWF_03715, partial [Chloroflexota bacterium]